MTEVHQRQLHEIPQLDRGGLRRFGLSMGGIVVGLFGLLLPWFFEYSLPLWPWIVAALFIVPAVLRPMILALVYNAWMRLALLLSRFTTPILMGAVFYIVITPYGLLTRLIRPGPLATSVDKSAETYRNKSEDLKADNIEKPY